MIRNEFLADVCDFAGLKDFCYENGCALLEDVYSCDEIDSIITEDLTRAVTEYGSSWTDIREYLNDIQSGYYWYLYSGFLDVCALDDSDFETYKNDVYEWAEDNEVFDDDDEDEDFPIGAADMDSEEPACVPFDVEGLSVDNLFDVCSETFTTILQQSHPNNLESELSF